MNAEIPGPLHEAGLPMFEDFEGNIDKADDVWERINKKFLNEKEIRQMDPEQVFSDVFTLNKASREAGANPDDLPRIIAENYEMGLQVLLRSRGYSWKNEGHARIFDTLSRGYLQQQRIMQERLVSQPPPSAK